MTPILELINLTKSFSQGDQRRTVLDGISTSVQPGEVIAIRGRSGSGKTTLLNLIAGLEEPGSGSVLIDGHDLTLMSERQRTVFRRENIGIVFQFFNLIPTLTVTENITLPLELGGRNRNGPDAAGLLERVGLADRSADYPDELSGGEQQRVAIARALIHEPALVLADEPTGNLDAATGDQVIGLLNELTRDLGRTLILVTHSHSLASIADRILAIQHGFLTPE